MDIYIIRGHLKWGESELFVKVMHLHRASHLFFCYVVVHSDTKQNAKLHSTPLSIGMDI